MSTSAIVTLVVVIVVLVAAALVVWPMMRRRRLRQRFGPEYDRIVADYDNRAVAERELVDREKRHRQFELKPLDPGTRERYAQQWVDVQAGFVDAPERSVVDADSLVTALMAERGYPTDGSHEQRAADLSVEHAATLEHYRSGHSAREAAEHGQASTEDLREAMVHYRVIFAELLDLHDDDDDSRDRHDRDVQDRHDRDDRDARLDRDEAVDGAYATRDSDHDGLSDTRDGAYTDRNGQLDGEYTDRADMTDRADTTRRGNR